MPTDADSALSEAELNCLRDVAETMIPADSARGMPAANDAAILADIVRSIGRDLPLVRAALAAITEKADGAFAALDRDRREAIVNDWHASAGAAGVALARAVLGAYYRDDRVLLALGHEARSPFPRGYTIEQGDWSLLDAVRDRPQLWRDDRTAGGGR